MKHKPVIRSAEFLVSSANYRQCPETTQPEIALIGRSNVGKSSLINMLLGRKALAMTSSKPGKTQLINHFIVNDQWYLVDLPGYGWAKVSKSTKAAWQPMIRDYLLRRENLLSVFVLIDSRLPPQKIDLEFIHWLGVNKVPFVIVMTKADKKGAAVNKNMEAMKKVLQATWEELPLFFLTSALKKTGKDDLLHYICESINDLNLKT